MCECLGAGLEVVDGAQKRVEKEKGPAGAGPFCVSRTGLSSWEQAWQPARRAWEQLQREQEEPERQI